MVYMLRNKNGLREWRERRKRRMVSRKKGAFLMKKRNWKHTLLLILSIFSVVIGILTLVVGI